eukprot:12286809-Alexandrium_andersonii.AAC.1
MLGRLSVPGMRPSRAEFGTTHRTVEHEECSVTAPGIFPERQGAPETFCRALWRPQESLQSASGEGS